MRHTIRRVASTRYAVPVGVPPLSKSRVRMGGGITPSQVSTRGYPFPGRMGGTPSSPDGAVPPSQIRIEGGTPSIRKNRVPPHWVPCCLRSGWGTPPHLEPAGVPSIWNLAGVPPISEWDLAGVLPHVDRHTDSSENITLPRTLYAHGNKYGRF